MEEPDLAVGDRFELPDEDIYGMVAEIIPSEGGERVTVVVECDDGALASVHYTAVAPAGVTIH